uniref:Ig-like domain-containing protein n=1 Tax=Myripristis murdjan TaxID=586833 RepID=A0A667WX88_9TELE
MWSMIPPLQLLQVDTMVAAMETETGTTTNRTAIQGQNISLLCRLTDTDEELTQISWQKKTREDPVNHNFYIISPLDGPKYVNGNSDRITFIGSTTENNGSVQLSHVRLLDEGVYTCIFTLFPSGIYKTEIPLTVRSLSFPMSPTQ